MNGRRTPPPRNPIAVRLIENPDSEGKETVQVMALVGFVGIGRGDDVRLFSDMDFQRYMDIPENDIVDSAELDDGGGRAVVWVKTDTMYEELFSDQAAALLTDHIQGSWVSTWPLIPATRYVAAQLLDLVPRLTDGEGPGPHLVPRDGDAPPDSRPA